MLASTICGVYVLFLTTVNGFPDASITSGGDISIPDIQIQLEKVLPQDRDGVDARCELCKFILNYLDTYLKNNQTEAFIDQTLHRLCNATSGTLKVACDAAIPFIEESIKQGFPPAVTCIKAGLCINKTEIESEDTSQLPENDLTSTAKPALVHVPLQSQTGQNSILKDQINNVLAQTDKKAGDGLVQNVGTLNDGTKTSRSNIQSNQIQQNVLQQPVQQAQLPQGIQNGQIQQNVQQQRVQQAPLLQGMQNNQIQQNVPQQPTQQAALLQGMQNNQIPQNAPQQPMQQASSFQGISNNQIQLQQPVRQASPLQNMQNIQIHQNAQQQPIQQGTPLQGNPNYQIQQNEVQQPLQQTTKSNQINQQQQDSIINQMKMGHGHLNLLPKSILQKLHSKASSPAIGLMPGPVILQPNQIGTVDKYQLDVSKDRFKTEKSTTHSNQNFPFVQKPLSSISYILGNRKSTFSYKDKSVTTSGNQVHIDTEDGFLDVNKAETEDDDWYHIDDDDDYKDEKDENKDRKHNADSDWNFLMDNDNDDDTGFKDNIDIDEEKTNQDQMNLETEWDTDKEKWDFKDFNTINSHSKPYFRELAVELNDINRKADTDSYERLNMIAFYSWILIMSFIMMACIILARNKYKYHPTGHKSYTWKTAAEEGKSLMKNVYS